MISPTHRHLPLNTQHSLQGVFVPKIPASEQPQTQTHTPDSAATAIGWHGLIADRVLYIAGGILSMFKQIVPELVRRRAKTCCACRFLVSYFCPISDRQLQIKIRSGVINTPVFFRVGPYLKALLILHLFFL